MLQQEISPLTQLLLLLYHQLVLQAALKLQVFAQLD
jgi:hypothetical protein